MDFTPTEVQVNQTYQKSLSLAQMEVCLCYYCGMNRTTQRKTHLSDWVATDQLTCRAGSRTQAAVATGQSVNLYASLRLLLRLPQH